MIEEQKKFRRNKKRLSTALARFIFSTYAEGNLNLAFSILYRSSTFAMLNDTSTGYYLKSEEELIFLIKKELGKVRPN